MVEDVIEYLEKHEIYPYSVFVTYAISNGALSITFYLQEDLDNFLDLVGYKKQLCDSTGYEVFRETLTVVLTDNALINFYITIK
jgi:hypothetical protein